MAEVSYTAQVTRESKTNFYYSFIFLPREKRNAIFDAYAFCRHVDDIVDEANGRDVTDELNEWRRGLDECYKGNATHPIYERLAPTVKRFNIPREPFHAIIDGCEMDLRITRYETYADLERYCYNVASAVGLVCISIFGYRNPASVDYAINLGKALQLTNIMRDVANDAERGRIYIPQDELKRFGLSDQSILERQYDARFKELMKHQYERASRYYQAADIRALGADRWPLFPAEVMGSIYHRLLEQIEASEFNVFDSRPRLPDMTKAAIALRIWLRAKTRGLTP